LKSRGPLAGYRIVEMAHHLAAPLAAMHLADFGADVVKVETLEGEDWRRWGRATAAGPGMSALFLAVNRNKRSLALDLRRPEGRRVLDRLLAKADVLLTNYAAEPLRELGLDARTLRRRFPRLIAASLSAFGTLGPEAGRRAFDIVVGGETGLLQPHPDGVSPPLVNTAPIADTSSALMVAYGVTLALLHRERTGRAERLWGRLCKALDLEALLSDARYTPWSELTARQLELRPLLDERFRTRTTDEWLARLGPAGVPAGRVNWGAAVFDHPQLRANGVVATTRHPRAGRMTGMGFPLRLPASPARLRRHAPQLGAHTREVLAELKYRAAEIRRLVDDHVVRVT